MTLDDYIVDTLMADLIGHDRQPSAFIVYLFLWRMTHGSRAAAAQVALQDIAERTGLSKRSVRPGLARQAQADRDCTPEHHGDSGVLGDAAVETRSI